MTAPMSPTADGALRRLVRAATDRAGAAEARCDMCRTAVPAEHRHILDEQRDELLCACQACALLFDREAAGRGHFRLVPRRRLRLPALDADELGTPVGLAFFVVGTDGSVSARYPSPMGATRWGVAPGTWRGIVRRCPALGDLTPLVEALLTNTTHGRHEHWIVPVDDCHRLVAVIRREWRGLSGGLRVWPAIDGFFADLGRRPASPVRAARPVHLTGQGRAGPAGRG
ncbi:hypothetical protein CcI156_19240 [Frankia sp. CcI156]|uniref:Uncharacterized protein n=2 Tax=Frankia casuarinae (strain DSM 45818 / CECT 9043 / HFP020203 / CcI3) TaxID=106370 RepID=Q2JBM3_FRACC|nr:MULTISPECIES: DUF5947 family protein [Frankia]ABD11319.1 conserved hypothetical protein [Frankia casuarinae]ETA00641.1 hypothetical protein CcI6DRAFT_03960 [Frankia sp. CcI6]EYT90753.1 hypothetical protein ThrDRAFT_03595 [Frankia casuarinae]KDA41597.1 hypothetical protein BMG523Draft_03599 [Frankia sp. BMG5.23]OFB40611.1 hypothetical protein Manayef4_18530 [Frankia sp. CgIM4]